jgi:hypothetical protein
MKDITLETVPKYASADDVAAELMKSASYFTTTTKPTLVQVNKFIMQSEEFVDGMTYRAWRVRQRSNEYKDLRFNQRFMVRDGLKFKLDRGFIKELSSTDGDKLEVWNGSEWEDWLVTKTEGRNKDFWLDYESGELFLRNFFFRSYKKIVRITYRYGETTIPLSINNCVAKLVAIKLLTNEDTAFLLNDSGNEKNLLYDPRISVMKAETKLILQNYANALFTL